ncbi:MAG: hybrid sensor histidine kinase/response regulator, partial [Nitrospirae bacterium]|nr:hybrid sensor histidine kinase/response regulator [Nitrospirota bacterium]
MIDDRELRDLFRVESEEHIRLIEKDLLRLESDPADAAALEEIFREVHSLKGASRMVGVTGVERLSHRMEDFFGLARKGKGRFAPEIFDLLYRALDAVRRLVAESVGGEPAGVDAEGLGELLSDALKRGLAGPGEIPAHPPIPDSPESVERETVSVPLPREEAGAGLPEWKEGKPFRIETIRVDTARLDSLLTHAGELNVMKTRIAAILRRIEEIADLSESFARSAPAGNGRPHRREVEEGLKEIRNTLREDHAKLEFLAGEIDGGIREIRLLPFATLFDLFPRMVRDLAKNRGMEIRLELSGGETCADKRIIEEMKDPLTHLIRNAVDHGIEPPEDRERRGKPRAGTIRLSVCRMESHLLVEASDDGRGIDEEAVRRAAVKRKLLGEGEAAELSSARLASLIFSPGFSTAPLITDTSGRGIGLDVVRANVERLKGEIQVASVPGEGSVFRVRLPMTLATARVLIVREGNSRYAIPVESVVTALRIHREKVFSMEGRKTALVNGRGVAVARLGEVLGISAPEGSHPEPGGGPSETAPFSCVVLSAGEDWAGVLVEELLDEQEVMLKPHGPLLRRVRHVSGGTILDNGEVCMVLAPGDLVKTIREGAISLPSAAEPGETERRRAVLLVEDSITTRTQEKRILEGAGYEVVTAVNGVEALSRLVSRSFDVVVSD